MSYRKEDHLPIPPRECEYCGEEFIPADPYVRICGPCYQELNDEYPEDEEENDEEDDLDPSSSITYH